MTSILLQNLAVLLVLVGGYIVIRAAAKREHWRSAWKQVSKNRLAMLSLAIITLYIFIGIADSVVWRDRSVDEAGHLAVDTSGKPIYELETSLLDRLCRPLTNLSEKT